MQPSCEDFFKERLDRHLDELAWLVSRDHGKVLGDARGVVLHGIEIVELACGALHLLKGSFSYADNEIDLRSRTVRRWRLGAARPAWALRDGQKPCIVSCSGYTARTRRQ